MIDKTEEMLAAYGDTLKQEGRWDGCNGGSRDGWREGLREGELRGKVLTIEGVIGQGVPWSTVEAATGVDQVTFARLKRQMEAIYEAT